MKLLLIISIIALSGCASSGLNGFCGRITAQEVTVPYIGGKTNIDGFLCHVGYVGIKGPNPDYSILESVMNHYSDSQTTQGKIMTTVPGTVIFTPSK